MISRFTRKNAFMMGIGVMLFANEVDKTLTGSGHAWAFALIGSWLVLDSIWWRTTIKWEHELLKSQAETGHNK